VAVQIFTVRQFAGLFGVSEQRVYGWVRDGKVDILRTPGNQIRIRYDRDLIGSQVQDEQKAEATA
jgi:excisionase family DNA binding protein